MWKLILYLLLFWFLYNLIFRFIVPVYRASSQFKKKFREMNENMQQQQRQQADPPPEAAKPTRPAEGKGRHDYIDFEEIH